MDFADRMIDYIEQNVSLYAPIRVGVLGDGNSIAFRPTPSTPPPKYLGGSKGYIYQFQILAQHSSIGAGLQAMQNITNALDGLENGAIVSNDGSFDFVKCDVYTLPNYVEKTTTGSHIWTAIFQAELFILKEG